MEFFNSTHETDYREMKCKFEAYNNYLHSIRNEIPSSAFDFATAPWHYNPEDPKCPHDSWVESLRMIEVVDSENDRRHLEIQLRLLGAYYDGHIELTYKKVSKYSLDWSPDEDSEVPQKLKERVAHGDWLTDEIRLSNTKKIIHEIEFMVKSSWVIECQDIEYKWMPLNPKK